MGTPKFKLQYLVDCLNRQRFSWKGVSWETDKEDVVISKEGRNQLLGHEIVKKIMNELRAGKTMSSMARDILEQLSKEYGKCVTIHRGAPGSIAFEIVDAKRSRLLSGDESKEVEARLLNITRLTVTRSLLEIPEALSIKKK